MDQRYSTCEITSGVLRLVLSIFHYRLTCDPNKYLYL